MNKYFFKVISVSAVALSCLSILSLPACGKKGPLYLENPQKPDTEETTKNKQTEKNAN